MGICTFFGHHDCPYDIKDKLKEQIKDLIENHSVDMFYMGNQGSFDCMARVVVKELAECYPHIRYAVVLAYIPKEKGEYEDYSDTMLPEGIEAVPKRFAISWRNKWLIRQSEFVVTYISHLWGGAAQYAELAVRQKKTVINLASK